MTTSRRTWRSSAVLLPQPRGDVAGTATFGGVAEIGAAFGMFGILMKHDPKFTAYTHPAGGWGSVQSVGRGLVRGRAPLIGTRVVLHQNKPGGFACVSCAWAKPAKPNPFEFCEEGAKATTWEITSRRCTPEFFVNHPSRRCCLGRIMRWKSRAGSPIPCVGTGRRISTSRSNGLKRSRNGFRTSENRSQGGGLLQFRPGFARSLVHVRVVLPALWKQQPARQLQHVP